VVVFVGTCRAKVDANTSGRAAITLQEVTHEETFENHLEQEGALLRHYCVTP
jgi:hypothetical protein